MRQVQLKRGPIAVRFTWFKRGLYFPWGLKDTFFVVMCHRASSSGFSDEMRETVGDWTGFFAANVSCRPFQKKKTVPAGICNLSNTWIYRVLGKLHNRTQRHTHIWERMQTYLYVAYARHTHVWFESENLLYTGQVHFFSFLPRYIYIYISIHYLLNALN